MSKKMFKLIKAQSVLEYIAASLVFTTVGIGGFLLTNQLAVLTTRGGPETYEVDGTLIAKTIEDGVAPEDDLWPSVWSEPQADLEGKTPEDTMEYGEEHSSDWNDGDEATLIGGSSQGREWLAGDSGVDESAGQSVDKEEYTSQELQAMYEQHTQEWIDTYDSGYKAEEIDYINYDLDQDWFMGGSS